MNVVEEYQKVRQTIPKTVKLVAVSKKKPVENIKELYDAGHRIFGENIVQELVDKQSKLPDDIEWHMIGHLQTNKVKYIAPFISMIQSVDSLKLLKEIDKRAKQNNRIIDCLFEMHIAKEQSKFGLTIEELLQILDSKEFVEMRNVNICGLMGIATNTPDNELVAEEFRGLKKTFDLVKARYFADNLNFREISMGMSSDYNIAISEGATIVRIGSLIFGKRIF
jgi:pyridoxal phosphate enzyme (YggS family)